MLKTSNLTLKRKQLFTPREGNPGNVLLTSRIRLQYFYQCLDFYLPNFPGILIPTIEAVEVPAINVMGVICTLDWNSVNILAKIDGGGDRHPCPPGSTGPEQQVARVTD